LKAVFQFLPRREIRAFLIYALLAAGFFFVCGSAWGEKNEAGPAAGGVVPVPAESPSSRAAEELRRRLDDIIQKVNNWKKRS